MTVVTIFFRGPDWNFYWPWEAWNPKLVPINSANFSATFWSHLAGMDARPTPWFLREVPGFLLAIGYFLLGLLIAHSLSRRTGYTAAY